MAGGDSLPDLRGVILKFWPCIATWKQQVNRWIASAYLFPYWYYPEEIIDLYIASQFLTEPWELRKALWMKEYGITSVTIEGFNFLVTDKSWASDLNAASSLPQYAVGVNCPCRNRDGFGQPYPVCPD